jgi:hypothetical protein
MSESQRQNNLFLGEDWTAIYSALKFINFNSYDFNTIRDALINYIRTNYPEDFNDWIESSEFVGIIEMLAYLASSLAFRIDLNVRENFLDTATRRESIFRLARFLSYNPRRCVASQGLMRIQTVRTDQEIYDSNGINLQNLTISWNDANNPDWFEQFILVLNASLQPSNPYGQPVKSGTVGSGTADRYDFNTVSTGDLVYAFTSPVNGQIMNFELCNCDFQVAQTGSISVSSTGYFYEKAPSVFNPWSMVYRNDGNGNSSAQTGFFMLFKQGSLGFTDYVLESPVPNRVIDVPAVNVNQTDVWAVSITDNGVPLNTWTKVPALLDSNLVYNDLNRLTRNIFQVVTRDQAGDDSISLRFGDGAFGNVPTGRLRVYYRTSNNQTYTILPQDITNVNLSLRYNSTQLTVNNITMGLDLTYAVSNSISRESNQSIRERASAVYYTQNRMVNGEDYNVFPLQNTQALKLRAVNRIYSGQSRFLDINDPTGMYQNTQVFSSDGMLYREPLDSSFMILLSRNLNTNQIVLGELQPLLSGVGENASISRNLLQFYLQTFENQNTASTGLRWYNTGVALPNASVGVFGRPSVTAAVDSYNTVILPQASSNLWPGSWVLMANGTWVNITSSGTSQLGTYGVVISGTVPSNTSVVKAIPPLRTTLTLEEQDAITAAINQKQSFGLRYDTRTLKWLVVTELNLAVDAPYSPVNAGNTSGLKLDSSWLIQMLYQASQGWRVTVRGTQYVFESAGDTTFYQANILPVINNQTLVSAKDNVSVLKYNLAADGTRLTQDVKWQVVSQAINTDGSRDSSSILVSAWDGNNDQIWDNPLAYTQLVPPNSWVFWRKQVQNGFTKWIPIAETQVQVYANLNVVPPVTDPAWLPGALIYVINPGIFLQFVKEPYPQLQDVSVNYRARTGRSNLAYAWQHYASSDSRIDPAIQNVIDAYVLTTSYDTAMRNWISRGRASDPQPKPPSAEDLRTIFGELDRYKMISDQIVWHPVKYRLLFGSQAQLLDQATFKVVKLPGAGVTDSEIRSRVIQAIDSYFSVVNWDFGQSFYFTELAAYIHQQMPTLLSSVVIVPVNADSQFGNMFEIRAQPDQMFISAARVTDVQIVANLTPAELRLTP